MAVKVLVITLFIFLPYVCGFMEKLFATHSTDRTYQRILRNEHHQENYKNSLLNDITPYCLQPKKHNQIENISEDVPAKWLNVLYEAERKLVNLLLGKTKLVYQELENNFNKDLITNFPRNYSDIENDIISRNLTIMINLNDRRKKKWWKSCYKNTA